MERMAWIAQLYDRMSGPAARMTRSLGGLQGALRDNAYWMQYQTKEQKMGTDALNKLGGTIGMVTTGILAAGVAFGTLAFKIGEAAFTQFAFKESALATGKALWGSADAADEMFKKATQLAKLTPFNVADVVTGFNKLGAAGFGKDEVPVVFQGLSDIAAMSGKGAEAIGSMTLAFSQIMGKGHLAGQELNQITESAGGAVSRLKLFGEIAKIMGVAETSIDSMMQNGLIPARVAIMGVMQVAKGLGGGVIGQNSIEQSKTLGGLWANLEDTVTNLWLTMDLTKMPWFGRVKEFLGALVDALDTSTQSGRVLQGVFERLFGKTIGAFLGDGDDMTDTVINLALAFEHFGNMGIAAFQGIWEGVKMAFGPMLDGMAALSDSEADVQGMRMTFQQLGLAVGYVATGIIAIAEAITAVIGPLDTFEKFLRTDVHNALFEDSGEAIGNGLNTGMSSSLDRARETLAANTDAMNADFEKANEINSPSKVWKEYGQNIIEGFNAGVDSVPGMDASLGSELAAGASSLAEGGGGSSAGSAPNVSLTIHVNGTGGEDGDSIAHKVADATMQALATLFDQVATERGLA